MARPRTSSPPETPSDDTRCVAPCRPLTPKQARFVAEYLIDLNATQAAIRAGYAPGSADVTGSRLLGNARVAAAVAEGREKQIAKAEMTADEWRKLVAQIARGDMRRLVDPETGALIPVNELDDEAAACLASVEVTREKTRITGEGQTTEESLVKVKLWDRIRALELMGKHLGMLKERVEHSGEVATVTRIVHTHLPADKVTPRVQ